MKKKHIDWILVIGWMILIFTFSSQVGKVSNENNKFVIYIFNLLGLNLNSLFGGLSNFIVRKAGHFTEYFILCVLLCRAINGKKKLKFRVSSLILLIVFLYASSDEFHQAFVPGREPAFRDVLIDTCAGIIALIIMYICVTLKKRSSSSNKVLTKSK